MFAYVKSNFDTVGDGVLSTAEIAVVTSIDCSLGWIQSLKGVEYFTALTELYCWGNALTELDVSKNSALGSLECQKNQLTLLNVSCNSELSYLWCSDNALTTLDLSHNPRLTFLGCGNNELTELDLSANPKMFHLDCGGNSIAALDLSGYSSLYVVRCADNALTMLDVSGDAELAYLECGGNALKSVNVVGCTELLERINNGEKHVVDGLVKYYYAHGDANTLYVIHDVGVRFMVTGNLAGDDNTIDKEDVLVLARLINDDTAYSEMADVDGNGTFDYADLIVLIEQVFDAVTPESAAVLLEDGSGYAAAIVLQFIVGALD